MHTDRREFLAAAAASAAALAIPRRAAAATGDPHAIRVAVIGVNSQGNGHLQNLGKRVVAICDADTAVLERRAGEHEEKFGRRVERFQDFRDLLEKADIDAVSIATPNHTHSMIAIAAIEAGKDVYVEKPVSHNLWEGRQLVAAAAEHKRIVQCGTQSRSSPSLQQAVRWVQSGQLGAIRYAIGTCYKPRKSIGLLESPLVVPASVDYDLWCGPAEKRELFRPNLHYDWHWDWNTGNGDMGNQGIHQMDIARWFLGEPNLAPRTISIGGRVGYRDAGDTPNTQVVLHAYERAPLVFETRGLPRSKEAQASWGDSMDRFRGSQIGVIVQCEEGCVVVPDYVSAYAYDLKGNEVRSWRGGGSHHSNWLEAVAARDPGLLNAPIREGHVSSGLCHTGGVSQRLGGPATAGEIAARLAANDLLSDSWERMASHLRANRVDVDGSPAVLTLGADLMVDPDTETFPDSDEATKLRSRDYRPGYEIRQYVA